MTSYYSLGNSLDNAYSLLTLSTMSGGEEHPNVTDKTSDMSVGAVQLDALSATSNSVNQNNVTLSIMPESEFKNVANSTMSTISDMYDSVNEKVEDKIKTFSVNIPSEIKLRSDELRTQFTSLKDKFKNIPSVSPLIDSFNAQYAQVMKEFESIKLDDKGSSIEPEDYNAFENYVQEASMSFKKVLTDINLIPRDKKYFEKLYNKIKKELDTIICRFKVRCLYFKNKYWDMEQWNMFDVTTYPFTTSFKYYGAVVSSSMFNSC